MAVPDAVIEGVAGAIGAVVSLTATYPLLTVSTLRALELRDNGNGKPQLQDRLQGLPNPVKDVIEFSRRKGWRALFAGLRPAVVATAASQGIYFSVYSVLRQAAVARKRAAAGGAPAGGAGSHNEGISVSASLLVASIAGCVNVLCTNPIWVVITQMQGLQRHGGDVARGASTLGVARQIYQDHGLAGFWRGLLPSMVMVVNPTFQYIFYEALVARALAMRRSRAGRRGLKPSLGALDVFLLSAMAKICSTLLTYPLLVVKNRLQAMNRHTEDARRYRGVADAVRRMWEEEGLAGFFRGMSIKLVQTVLAAALLMTLKEEIYSATRIALGGARPGGISAARARRSPPPRR